jgi:hypothetical protein
MMILEGIVTTINDDGSTNISPMGPVVDRDLTRLRLRPYQTSTTYTNLRRLGEGVFHVTDDVELLARCAVGAVDPTPELKSAESVRGRILADCCRWYAFRVSQIDDRQPRTEIDCEIVARGRLRDFFGFNRAKHAVVEAAILATRVDLLPHQEILAQFAQLSVIVDKTAGDQEHRAFDFLREYIQTATSQ